MKNMKNQLFNMKSVIKGSYKANVGAGAETKSYGSTTLVLGSPFRWVSNLAKCH
jgi:hypothetical protein